MMMCYGNFLYHPYMTTFLSVPAEDKPQALTLGAALDPESGHFFVPPGAELARFKHWLLTPSVAVEPALKGVGLAQLLARVAQVIDRLLLNLNGSSWTSPASRRNRIPTSMRSSAAWTGENWLRRGA